MLQCNYTNLEIETRAGCHWCPEWRRWQASRRWCCLSRDRPDGTWHTNIAISSFISSLISSTPTWWNVLVCSGLPGVPKILPEQWPRVSCQPLGTWRIHQRGTENKKFINFPLTGRVYSFDWEPHKNLVIVIILDKLAFANKEGDFQIWSPKGR